MCFYCSVCVCVYWEQDMNFLMTTRNSNNLVDSLETLSIFQRILLQQGCIVVNINIDKFRTMLRSMTAEEY